MILFFSDLHGSAGAAAALRQVIDRRKPEKIVFLGDAVMPYESLAATALFRDIAPVLLAVLGNCDDQATLNEVGISAAEYAIVDLEGLKCFLTHGDRWNRFHLPPAGMGDVLIHGHTHIPEASHTDDGMIIFNPGSAGNPRGGFPHSYGILENRRFAVLALADDELLAELDLKQPE